MPQLVSITQKIKNMFNTGYKEVVLNSAEQIQITADNITIPGYISLDATAIKDFKGFRAQPRLRQIVDVDAIAGEAGAVYDIVISLKTVEGNRSDYARDFIVDGERIIFQTTPLDGTAPEDMVIAVTKGFENFKEKYNSAEMFVDVVSFEPTKFSVVITLEGEDLIVEKITSQKAYPLPSIPDPTNPYAPLQYKPAKVELNLTVSQDHQTGMGLGYWLEESRRMATGLNVLPYKQQSGGNSQGIDVEGKYATFYVVADIEDSGDWAGHEYLKHQYVNAATPTGPTRYVIYINEKVLKAIEATLPDFLGSLDPNIIELYLANGSLGADDGSNFFGALMVPTLAGVQSGVDAIVYTWDEIPFADIYRIEWDINDGATVGADTTTRTYTLTGLASGDEVTAVVYALSNSGESSEASNEITITIS